MTGILYMLFGAFLVAGGVIASAFADKIRGLRQTRPVPAVPRTVPTPARPSASVRQPIEVIEAELVPTLSPKPPRTPPSRGAEKSLTIADDVIAALVATGFKKPQATEATWACGEAERATVEAWTKAALRRCAKGNAS